MCCVCVCGLKSEATTTYDVTSAFGTLYNYIYDVLFNRPIIVCPPYESSAHSCSSYLFIHSCNQLYACVYIMAVSALHISHTTTTATRYKSLSNQLTHISIAPTQMCTHTLTLAHMCLPSFTQTQLEKRATTPRTRHGDGGDGPAVAALFQAAASSRQSAVLLPHTTTNTHAPHTFVRSFVVCSLETTATQSGISRARS